MISERSKAHGIITNDYYNIKQIKIIKFDLIIGLSWKKGTPVFKSQFPSAYISPSLSPTCTLCKCLCYPRVQISAFAPQLSWEVVYYKIQYDFVYISFFLFFLSCKNRNPTAASRYLSKLYKIRVFFFSFSTIIRYDSKQYKITFYIRF